MAEENVNIEQTFVEIALKVNPDGAIKGGKSAAAGIKVAGDSAKKTGGVISDAFDDAARSVDKSGNAMSKSLQNAYGNVQKTVGKTKGVIEKIIGPLGLGLGITSLITMAHGLNREIIGWNNNFKALSDASGDTSRSVGSMISVWNKSKGSLSTIQSTMSSLGSQGLPVANKEFEKMATWVTDVYVATGISADALTSFTVGLNQMYAVSLESTRMMTSAMVALGDGFNFTNTQVEAVMRGTGNILEKMGMFFEDVDDGMRSMTVGIGSATAAMKKMGVSVQIAGDFFGNILDPENINENLALFARLGISYQDTMSMMTSSDGKEMFFDKLMTNLPRLSKQIVALKNPMARLQFAKGLGLPLEIAQKMARGTREEISQIMVDYKDKAKEEKAIEKKQQKTKAEEARFADTLHFLKMRALKPLMDFSAKWLPLFIKGMGIVADKFAIFAGGVADVTGGFMPAVESLMNGDNEGFWNNLQLAAENMMKVVWGGISSAVTHGLQGAGNFLLAGVKTMWKNNPITSGILGAFATLKIGKFLASTVSNALLTKKQMAGLSWTGVQKVKDVGIGGSKGGSPFGDLSLGNTLKGKGGVKGKIAAVLGGLALSMAANYGMDALMSQEGEIGNGGIADKIGTGSNAAMTVGSIAGSVSGKATKVGTGIAGKVGGKAAAKAGAKFIPVAGWAFAAADAAYSVVDGVMNAGKALGKAAMTKEEQSELTTLIANEEAGRELSNNDIKRKKDLVEKDNIRKELKRLKDKEQLGITLNAKELSYMEEYTVQAEDRWMGFAGGLTSFFTLGLLDTEEMTKYWSDWGDGVDALDGQQKSWTARVSNFFSEKFTDMSKTNSDFKAAVAKRRGREVAMEKALQGGSSIDVTRAKRELGGQYRLEQEGLETDFTDDRLVNIFTKAGLGAKGDINVGAGYSSKIGEMTTLSSMYKKNKLLASSKNAAIGSNKAAINLELVKNNAQLNSTINAEQIAMQQAAIEAGAENAIQLGNAYATVVTETKKIRGMAYELNETGTDFKISTKDLFADMYAGKGAMEKAEVKILMEKIKGSRAEVLEASKEYEKAKEEEKKKNDKKTHKLLSGIGANTKKTADNTRKVSRPAGETYIDFWIRNQGFQTLTFKA